MPQELTFRTLKGHLLQGSLQAATFFNTTEIKLKRRLTSLISDNHD